MHPACIGCPCIPAGWFCCRLCLDAQVESPAFHHLHDSYHVTCLADLMTVSHSHSRELTSSQPQSLTSAAFYLSRPLCACRVELCSNRGDRLRQFSLDECKGGPHEFRGVARSELLSALKSAIPTDAVRYGYRVSSVSAQPEGTADSCIMHMLEAASVSLAGTLSRIHL